MPPPRVRWRDWTRRISIVAVILMTIPAALRLCSTFRSPDVAPSSRRTADPGAPAGTASRVDPPREDPARTPPTRIESITLAGQVLDSEGRSVPRADVMLADMTAPGDVGTPERPVRDTHLRTRADDAGRFEFRNLAPGPRRLIASPADAAPGWTDVFDLRASDTKLVRLGAPVRLQGTTVPGAALRVAYRLPGAGERAPRTARAVSDGSFALTDLPADLPFTVDVRAPRFRARVFGPFTLAPGGHLMDFPLQPGRDLEGRVRTAAGDPVAGARAAFRGRTGESGADGIFRFDGLEDEPAALVITRDGYLPAVLQAVEPGRVDITLLRATRLRGRVAGAAGGKPLYVTYRAEGASYRAKVLPVGTFELSQVSPGRVDLAVEDEERRRVGGATVYVPDGDVLENVVIEVR
jgi:carboxypeptidase family protein